MGGTSPAGTGLVDGVDKRREAGGGADVVSSARRESRAREDEEWYSCENIKCEHEEPCKRTEPKTQQNEKRERRQLARVSRAARQRWVIGGSSERLIARFGSVSARMRGSASSGFSAWWDAATQARAPGVRSEGSGGDEPDERRPTVDKPRRTAVERATSAGSSAPSNSTTPPGWRTTNEPATSRAICTYVAKARAGERAHGGGCLMRMMMN